MQRWKNGLFNASFALNCLLLFLLVFEDRLFVPRWLQVVGRMHPLLLHFPLVLVILYAVTVIIHPPSKTSGQDSYRVVSEFLLLFAALTSAITALMGLFLSKEEGYDPEAMKWHKWGGVAIPLITLAWYSFRNQIQSTRLTTSITSVMAIVLILFTGHHGAGITHGQDFLLSPILPEKKAITVSPAEAVVFAHLVQPILENKCLSCHNNRKAKGELIMETRELLLKGGKSGALWDSTDPGLGLLMQRVHLPLEHKKHMPPKGKPQLTEEEIGILSQWIRKGADFDLRVAQLAPADTLRQIAEKILAANEDPEYSFEEADPGIIKNLNTANRVIIPQALHSPALIVNFYNSQLFRPEQLKELGKIRKQIVELNLSRMPLADEDLKFISEFENLRKLNLSFTGINGSGLTYLQNLKHLELLSLSGTNIMESHLEALSVMPALGTVYAWNTPVPAHAITQIQNRVRTILFETGYQDDTTVLKLSPPVLLNEEAFLESAVPLKLRHYINGVSIRYTLDGSEPDSLLSPEFRENIMINQNTLVKARAFKPGWIQSDLLEASFLKHLFIPDTVIHLSLPNKKYRDDHGKLLFNREKGEKNFQLGNWVAFRENRMECLLRFDMEINAQSVTLNTLIDIGSYIMPARSIEVWGGMEPGNLRKLVAVSPQQPTEIKPAFTRSYECKFKPVKVKYLKIMANPVTELPAWHPGKGDKGWIFIDELLVN